MSDGGAKATRPGDQGGCAESMSSSWRAHKSEADVKNMAARHASSHGTGDEVGFEVTVEAVLAAVVLFISWQALHNADLIDIGFQKKRSRDQASSRRTLCTAKESNEECEECSAELGAGSWSSVSAWRLEWVVPALGVLVYRRCCPPQRGLSRRCM